MSTAKLKIDLVECELTARQIVCACGGGAVVAARLGVGVSAVSNAVVSGSFPSAWWQLIDQLCAEKGVSVSKSLFRWRSPPKCSQADCATVGHV